MIVAMAANAHIGKDDQPFSARSFHPYYPECHQAGSRGGIRVTADNIDLLQDFVD